MRIGRIQQLSNFNVRFFDNSGNELRTFLPTTNWRIDRLNDQIALANTDLQFFFIRLVRGQRIDFLLEDGTASTFTGNLEQLYTELHNLFFFELTNGGSSGGFTKADNGLSIRGTDAVILGGQLDENTDILLNGNDFNINGSRFSGFPQAPQGLARLCSDSIFNSGDPGLIWQAQVNDGLNREVSALNVVRGAASLVYINSNANGGGAALIRAGLDESLMIYTKGSDFSSVAVTGKTVELDGGVTFTRIQYLTGIFNLQLEWYQIVARGTSTFTLPLSPKLGTQYAIFANNNNVTINAQGSNLIIGQPSISIAQYDSVIVTYLDTNTWLIS